MYEGWFENNEYTRRGRFVNYNGDWYEGEYVNSKAYGKGVLQRFETYRCEGEFIDDLSNG